MDKNEKANNEKQTMADTAETGNTSNSSPPNTSLESEGPQQLLNKKAEKYLREAGSIEDLPDAEEEAEK